MRSFRSVALTLLTFVALLAAACSSESGDGASYGGDAVVDTAGDIGADSLFGDWGSTDAATDSEQDSDGAADGEGLAPDTMGETNGSETAPDKAEEAVEEAAEEAVEEVYVPVDWDIIVLTAVKGHLYRNGAYYTQVQNHTDALFVAVDGLKSEIFTVTADGQGRRDTDPFFQVDGAPAGTSFVDIAVASDLMGLNAFTLESNGEVRTNGGHLMSVPVPGGESFVAISVEEDSDEFYLATNLGRVLKKNAVHSIAFPVTAADPLVDMSIENGQLYGLTRSGKIYKNSAVFLDLSAKAAPPFVDLDVTPEHVYAVTEACAVFEDSLKVHEFVPFTGDYCAGVAGAHSLF